MHVLRKILAYALGVPNLKRVICLHSCIAYRVHMHVGDALREAGARDEGKEYYPMP